MSCGSLVFSTTIARRTKHGHKNNRYQFTGWFGKFRCRQLYIVYTRGIFWAALSFISLLVVHYASLSETDFAVYIPRVAPISANAKPTRVAWRTRAAASCAAYLEKRRNSGARRCTGARSHAPCTAVFETRHTAPSVGAC